MAETVVPYTPRDVPRLRERLRRMWASDAGRFFAEIDLARAFHRGNNDTADYYQEAQDTLLAGSALYWVSSEMTVLLRFAADTMPPEVLNPLDIPADYGFIVFEEPLRALDTDLVNNDALTISAISWGCVTVRGLPCLQMNFYQRTDEMMQREGGLKPGERSTVLIGDLYFLGASTWKVGAAADDWGDYYDAADDTAKASYLEDRKLTHAFFLLIRQRVTSVATRAPDRAERRRAERAGYAQPPAVRIVTLRQRSVGAAPLESRQVDWTHRWMVSGHWKNQWHPKEQRHVPTLISPFIKGPPDKPLVEKTTVHALRR